MRLPFANACITSLGCLALLPIRASAADDAPAVSTRPKTQDQTIVLNPFEVQADNDKSYSALNSNSITTFNVSLDNVPITADIMDEAFMKDVASTTVEGMLTAYDAAATFGGSGPAQPAVNQPGDHGSNPGLGLRGSRAGLGVQIDGLQLNAGNYGDTSFGSSTNYFLERVEVLNGPQALLYDGSGAGGVINTVEKRAMIGKPAFGEFSYRIDQYGTKYATLDYGASYKNVAVRFAFVDGTLQSRRLNLSDRLKGGYGQIAAQIFNTRLSISLRQSVDTRSHQDYTTITSAGDPVYSKFNGQNLSYILYTGQGDQLDNGHLNWSTYGSFAGYQYTDFDVSESAIIKAETTWTPWLSTQIMGGYANLDDMDYGYSSTLNFYSPGATNNPLPGNWTMNYAASGPPMQSAYRPHTSKAFRAVALLTNDLFHGKIHSQTSLEGDFTGTDASLPTQNYWQADSNWNIIYNPAVTKNNGRTGLPALNWTVNNGPVYYGTINPNTDRFTYQGINYVRQATNLGVQGRSYYFQKGYAVINYSQWLDGKLDTLLGARVNEINGSGDGPLTKPEYSAGVEYHLLPWLAPYVQASDLWLGTNNTNPDGTISPSDHDVNEEFGFKFTPRDSKVSGSLSYYRRLDTNESYNVPGVSSDISPSGLNGQIPQGTSNNVGANVLSNGVTAALTANPTHDWRMRLSAAYTGGHFKQRVQFGQLYNDQFHEDKNGNVTYADGTIVYVPATFNSKQLTVSSTTAGAVPLTVNLLSTPGSQYYASPQPVSGAILKTSNGGLVLLSAPDPTHGSILTGATGLPISAYQLNTALSGVTPPGTINAAEPGGQTTGYPEYSFNLTNMYEFSHGPLKGFKAGGTVSANWKYLITYYYSSLANVAPSALTQYYYPTSFHFDLITGYTRKFGRITWSTQLNVNNLFNHYHVVLFPNISSGFTTITNLSANFDAQPRAYTWTNRIAF